MEDETDSRLITARFYRDYNWVEDDLEIPEDSDVMDSHIKKFSPIDYKIELVVSTGDPPTVISKVATFVAADKRQSENIAQILIGHLDQIGNKLMDREGSTQQLIKCR